MGHCLGVEQIRRKRHRQKQKPHMSTQTAIAPTTTTVTAPTVIVASKTLVTTYVALFDAETVVTNKRKFTADATRKEADESKLTRQQCRTLVENAIKGAATKMAERDAKVNSIDTTTEDGKAYVTAFIDQFVAAKQPTITQILNLAWPAVSEKNTPDAKAMSAEEKAAREAELRKNVLAAQEAGLGELRIQRDVIGKGMTVEQALEQPAVTPKGARPEGNAPANTSTGPSPDSPQAKAAADAKTGLSKEDRVKTAAAAYWQYAKAAGCTAEEALSLVTDYFADLETAGK